MLIPWPAVVLILYIIISIPRGFLEHESMDFQFIGPDRQPPVSTFLKKYISMVRAIKLTNLPNYNAAIFLVYSELNVDAWHHHLKGYHNKKLIEYLTYGFPLSLQDHTNLSNNTVTDNYSAIVLTSAIPLLPTIILPQFPLDIQQYLNKEISLDAILGPFSHIKLPDFYCSPLLTRPKNTH